ncbi:hypothetical protein [Brucella anthropi]|uniref:hypothetical protein n=1 Tax=Brucella/Ochrobactrum group TaxID=2826938 RepID=UPI00124C23E2|nr:hypothetical protein [Brucella anthropi]KAB2779417.1 DUF1515 domain-containing protein [Brucella anthropi]MCH4540219.1 hypothetical protein [Ochrobactrum sp. A-1]
MTEAGQERAIGRIEGKLDLIISDQEKARQDRKQQYERQEKTERLLEALQRNYESVDSRLEKVEEPVADFNRWRERGVGAIMLVSFFAATFGAILASFWKKILALITG